MSFDTTLSIWGSLRPTPHEVSADQEYGAARRAALDRMLASLRGAWVAPIVSSPVHTVAADSSIGVIAETLASWGNSGAPVLKYGELSRIISRRDVESALAPARGHTTHMHT